MIYEVKEAKKPIVKDMYNINKALFECAFLVWFGIV